MPLEAIIGAYQAILGTIAEVPSSNALLNCLLVFNVPFTFCKGLLDVGLCFLIYKPLSPCCINKRKTMLCLSGTAIVFYRISSSMTYSTIKWMG